MTIEPFDALISKMKKFSVVTIPNLPFSRLTSFGSGGTIKLTIYPDTKRKLIKSLKLLDKLKIPYYVLGKGSNVLAADGEYPGVVVCTTKLCGIQIKGCEARALCGTSTMQFAKTLCKEGLSGGEFFACLPATVGGATVCNAGCFGQDVASVVKWVEAYGNGKVRRFKAEKCQFRKRSSLFKNSNYVVLSAAFRLTQGVEKQISAKIDDIRQKKTATQPLDKRSAGSALYHDRVAVSRLIDQAGLKGYSVGDAQVSTKHAGFVVNNGNATSAQILQVIKHVQDELYARYGVVAHTEITLLNFKDDK